MTDEDRRPYFLWDEDLSIAEVRRIMDGADDARRPRLMAKILREARDDEVWAFLTVRQVVESWPQIAPILGRRRAFWEFLLHAWKRRNLIG